MTYEEALDYTCSAFEAESEILQHAGCSFVEFQAEYGVHPTYSGADVLAWLGY